MNSCGVLRVCTLPYQDIGTAPKFFFFFSSGQPTSRVVVPLWTASAQGHAHRQGTSNSPSYLSLTYYVLGTCWHPSITGQPTYNCTSLPLLVTSSASSIIQSLHHHHHPSSQFLKNSRHINDIIMKNSIILLAVGIVSRAMAQDQCAGCDNIESYNSVLTPCSQSWYGAIGA